MFVTSGLAGSVASTLIPVPAVIESTTPHAVIVTLVALFAESSVASTPVPTKLRLALDVSGVHSSWIICHVPATTKSHDQSNVVPFIDLMLVWFTNLSCLASTAVFTAFCDG